MKTLALVALMAFGFNSIAEDKHGHEAHHASTTAAAPASSSHTSAHGDGPTNPYSGSQALEQLKTGNKRFISGKVRKDGASSQNRELLSKGQAPYAIVVSCSDSRVPPEVVFDQKLGEIFVVRSAGQTLDYSEIGSIEYAVSHLGSKLILVMGHESCGAVKAALSTLKGGDAGSPSLNQLVATLHPGLKKFEGKEMSKGVLEESWTNTNFMASLLIEKSKIIRDAVASGDVKLQTALYHLGTGEVEFR